VYVVVGEVASSIIRL